ncbi:peroxidase 44-like isoform X2 [Panicum hallii]|uniref:peroxidase 44-like isoform X2 n=1 Tax=Panicum hallii TaxID=206008 RepID=UPI000DF4CD21|nr:peroxidase 44-like isoform X2 [Panicum hallii]
MAVPRLLLAAALVLLLLAVGALPRGADAQLSAGFYSASCPAVHGVVRQVVSQAVMNDSRSGAAILRLFYHDCFVNGCDASVLLDDTPATPGEKGAGANAGGSTFGFDLIDAIKTQVEAACPGTVSCADILALAARDSVNLRAARRPELGGPARPARRDVPERDGRGDGPPGPGLGPRPPRGRLRRQGPHVAGPRGAVGCAHGGHGAVPQLPRARLLRRQREPRVRGPDAGGLPGVRRGRRGRAAGRGHPQRVRQRILPEPGGRRGAAALRPGALQQRAPRRACAALQRQRRRLLVGLRRVHGQARERRTAHGLRGGGQARLQESKLVVMCFASTMSA